jgi:hypothetical protein
VNRTITDGTNYLKGRWGLPKVKHVFSKRGLGKCKPVRGSKGDKK